MLVPPSACWLIVFKSMDYWWHEKWPSLFSMLFLAIGFGSDLVYRVVFGWRFGPVPNNVDKYLAFINCFVWDKVE